jgi:hypothetical protein
MNISKIVKKVLSEQNDKNVKGLNQENQIEVLKTAKEYCKGYSKYFGADVTTLENQFKGLFPGLAGVDNVAKITYENPTTKTKFLFFGIEDPKAQTSADKKAYLGYEVRIGMQPRRFRDGWGQECDALQEVTALGTDELPAEYEALLKSFISRNPKFYSEFNPNSAEFEKVMYKDLVDPQTGQLVLKGYTGPGYLWVRKGLSNQDIDVYKSLDNMLVANKLTRKRPEDVTSDEFNFAFLLSDISDDLPGLEVDDNLRTSTIVWPAPGTIVEPTKESCRAAIKKLSDCSKSASGIGCRKDLFSNKITALLCGDKNFVGGALGLKDEYASLLQDTGDFGLSNLNYARREGVKRAKAPASPAPEQTPIREGLKGRVSKYLNEEFKRRNFLK